MAFKYHGHKRTIEDINRYAKEGGGAYDNFLSADVTAFKGKEGDSEIRILPPTWMGDDKLMDKWGKSWALSIYVHYNVGSGSYLCRRKMNGDDDECPICNMQSQAADEEEARQLQPSRRRLCYVIERGNEKAGPQVWAMPNSVFTDIMNDSQDKKRGTPLLIDHPDEGYDIELGREGTKLNTRWKATVVRDPSPIAESEKQQDRWLDYVEKHPLTDLLVFHEPDYIEKAMRGGRKNDTDDEEDKSPRARRRGDEEEAEPATKSSRRSRRDEPEEEEDTSPRARSRSEEPDEEEDRPVRRSRRSKEEEPEDNSDEEETSPRRKRPLRDDDNGEAEEEPTRRSRKADDNDDDDDDDQPTRRRRYKEDDDNGGDGDADEDDEKPRRRGASEQAKEALTGLRKRRR